VRRHLGRVVGREGLTHQQYNVLRILRGAGGTPLSALEIGERLIEETPGVSRLIERLVAKGLVRRDRGRSARRARQRRAPRAAGRRQNQNADRLVVGPQGASRLAGWDATSVAQRRIIHD
jgi:DNA-binding MarR family transcriptional regulator